MSSPKTVNRIAATLLVVCFSGAALTARHLEILRGPATLEEVLYIQSPKAIRIMSLGNTGLTACIYWTRAVQYFGGKNKEKAKRFDLLEPLLNLTTDLDPHLLIAYQFGSVFLSQNPPFGAGTPDAAVRLVEKGIRENPEYWRFYFTLGFIHAIERQDYKAASEAFEKGSNVPGALSWMKVMAAEMAKRGGDIQTSRFLWTKVYESTEDKMLKENALRHLVALRVDEDVSELERLATEYKNRTGHLPGSWSQMINAGLLRGVPLDPTGTAYRMMPGGRIEVRDSDRIPFIRYGLPPGKEKRDLLDFSRPAESTPETQPSTK